MHSTQSAGLASSKDTKPHTYQDGPFPPTIKFDAAKQWLSGASLRGTRDALDHKAIFSHESVRQWAHRRGHHLDRHNQRDVVVVDETSLFTHDGTEVFGWAALDAATREVFLTGVTQGRSGMEAWLFFKNVLRRCTNQPFVIVDAGVWYPWPLNRLGFDWEIVSGGDRNLVEAFFGSL